MRVGGFSDRRQALGEAIILIKMRRFKSIQDAFDVIVREPGMKITLENGLIYGFDGRYGGFVVYDTDAITVLSPCCPVSVCDGQTAGGHICWCALYANRTVTTKEENDYLYEHEPEPAIPDTTQINEFITQLCTQVRPADIAKRPGSHLKGKPIDGYSFLGLAALRSWSRVNSFNPFQLPDDSKMMVTCHPRCEAIFICTNEAQFPLCSGLNLATPDGESKHEVCRNRALHANKRWMHCPIHYTYNIESNPPHYHKRLFIVIMVEIYKFINSGLSETDDQTLFAKWVRVVKYLYSRGNMGIATVRAGIDMMISVDVNLNICYNAGIRLYRHCCYPYCLHTTCGAPAIGLCKNHDKKLFKHYNISRKEYVALIKGKLPYGYLSDLNDPRRDRKLSKSAPSDIRIREVKIQRNSNV